MNFEWHFNRHNGRRIDKWRHYFEIYDRHFDRYRNQAIRVLEIGIDHGGSLQLWKKYFGPWAQIVGLDIDPRCAEYVEDQVQVHIGNQSDVGLLRSLGEFDIVIDDGSHRVQDQSASFEVLWPKTKSVYLIEDCHAGYPALVGQEGDNGLSYAYPWVAVLEKPQRIIRGEPSRALRPDEMEVTEKCHADRIRATT